MIEGGGLAYILHTAFQNQSIEPGVLLGLRSRNDPIPEGERAFLLASTRRAVEKGETPVKIQNFVSDKNKKKGGGG